MKIGVVAIQGGFEAHVSCLQRLGAGTLEVRDEQDMIGLDGLVIPGGESTTITKGLDKYGLRQPIVELASTGAALFGTCAGLIMLDMGHLGLLDVDVRRNAFGRQLASFESELKIEGLGEEPVRAVFIRAPWVERCGDSVDVLAGIDGHPVAVRQGNVLAVSFHPELTNDLRLHALFLAMAESKAPEQRLEVG